MIGEAHERLIAAIYGAAVERESADAVFSGIVAAVGGSSGWVNDFSANDVAPVIAGLNVNPDVVAPYRAHYFRDDPWPRSAYLTPTRQAVSLSRFVPDREFVRSEVYADLLHPGGADIRHNLAMRFDYPDRFRGIAIFRGDGRDGFELADERLLTMLGAHLERVFAVWDAAPAAARRIDAFAQGRSIDVALAVDGQGRLIDANAAGAALLARGRLLRVALDRTLRWRSADDARAIDGLVGQAARFGIGGTVVAHDGDGVAYHLRVDPWPPGAGAPAALLTLRDVGRMIATQVSAGERRFAFSPSEAALATTLMRGRSIEGHAATRGISIETARKQLGALFRKTGTRRQAELVALLHALPA